jgi:hypothetical protein
MTTDELIERFENLTLPAGEFHHRQHVQAAWGYLQRHELPDALARFTRALRNFADAHGASGKYHATITTAFMLVMADRLATQGSDEPWEAFASANPDLLCWKPSVLGRYYRAETLASDGARRHFRMPDLRED